MKLCRYWATAETFTTDGEGRPFRLRKWGGSNDSPADAKAKAARALEELRARVEGIGFKHFRDYSYSMRDVPEELVKELGPDSGITRNGKGCLVLNSATAFFADIDVREPGAIAKLFGASRKKREEEYLVKLREFISRHADIGARVYRTRAGLRYLFTHAPLPVNDEAIGWLKELGSDKMYVRLCKNQKCYRARLTPKPYRVGSAAIIGHYPFEKEGEKEAFDSWLRSYEENSNPYAVCSYIGTEGQSNTHRDLSAVVAEHDRVTRINENLPLA